MGIEVTISADGQVVIPKDVCDALGLGLGGKLQLELVGNRMILEAPQPSPERERISYEEFRRRVPKYTGPTIAIEDMKPDFDFLWRDRNEHDRR